jgi:peptidoglycan/LPS O-acetylase OafA/YrhL
MARLGHVRGFDGIRGVAIAAVVAYHFLGLPGGFYGVDVFFVLSGFLITTLLLEEHETSGRISFRDFYRRRARRLLPGLGPIIMFSLLAALLNLVAGPPGYAWVRLRGALSALFYVANVVEASGRRLPVELTPFWSLAQEEQFYLVWPVILLFLLRRRIQTRRLAQLLFGYALAVIGWRAGLAFAAGPSLHVMYGPDTRSDGLAIGAALAALRFARVLKVARMHPVALVSFLVLVALPLDAATAYGIGVPLAELSAVGLVMAGLSRSRILSVRPLTWLGSISYGVYLWQGPVMLVGGHGLVAASVSVGLGWASTRLVEQPFRRRSGAAAAQQVSVSAPA